MLSPEQLEARRRGGKTRSKQFTSEYQSALSKAQSRDQKQKAGHAGFAATVDKRGISVALEKLADHRRKHPSSLEQSVMVLLDVLDIPYQREANVAGWFVDFLITDRMLVIEVDGDYFHRNRNDVDDRKDATLVEAGYRVVRLPEQAIKQMNNVFEVS